MAIAGASNCRPRIPSPQASRPFACVRVEDLGVPERTEKFGAPAMMKSREQKGLPAAGESETEGSDRVAKFRVIRWSVLPGWLLCGVCAQSLHREEYPAL